MIGIGVFFFLRSKGANEKDYFLGGRQMNGWVAALSAGGFGFVTAMLLALTGLPEVENTKPPEPEQ